MKLILINDQVRLGQVCYDRNNNLDVIRLIAALFVIFSHSFPVSYGLDKGDYLFRLTSGRINLGGVAVGIFFVFGGFLIAKSALKVDSAVTYFKSRILRIFPALFFTTFCLTFIIGPIITSLPIRNYFTNQDTYKYLLNSILILQHNLPGVFEENVVGQTVNGPLWTLPIEFLCYILCFIALKIGLLSKKRFIISVPIFCIGIIGLKFLSTYIPIIKSALVPIGLFYIGMAMFIYKDKIILSCKMALILSILFILCFIIGLVDIAMILLFPYIMFTLAYGTRNKLILKKGEFSYGIYLWGWPIQQIVCSMFNGSMNNYLNVIITIPLTAIMGAISYYIIEKPALKLKR